MLPFLSLSDFLWLPSNNNCNSFYIKYWSSWIVPLLKLRGNLRDKLVEILIHFYVLCGSLSLCWHHRIRSQRESALLFIATLLSASILYWTHQGSLTQTGHKGKDSEFLMQRLQLRARLWQSLPTCLSMEKATWHGVCSLAHCAPLTGSLFFLTTLGDWFTLLTWFLKLICHDVEIYLSLVLLENSDDQESPILLFWGK